MNVLVLTTALAAALLCSTSLCAATVIDTTPNENGSIGAIGSPGNAATFGQTFTVGLEDTTLSTFTMFLIGRRDASLDLRGYVAAWDDTNFRALGIAPLYSSPTVTMNGDGTRGEFTFSPNIALAPLQRYVVFLSTSELLPQPGSGTYALPLAQDSLPAERSVFQDNGSDFGSLFTSGWSSITISDLSFRVNLGPAAVVTPPDSAIPEASTWALMILGFASGGVMLRRRRGALARVG